MKKFLSIFSFALVAISIFSIISIKVYAVDTAKVEQEAIDFVLNTTYKNYSQTQKNLLVEYYNADDVRRNELQGENGTIIGRSTYTAFVNEVGARTAVFYQEEKAKEDEAQKQTVDDDLIKDVDSQLSYATDEVVTIWGMVADFIKSMSGLDITKYNDIDRIINIMKLVAVSIAYISWLVGVMNEGLKYELLTYKTGVKLFVGFIVIGVLINKSIDICMAVVNFNNEIVGNIIPNDVQNLFAKEYKMQYGNFEKSNLWIIGGIVDWFKVHFSSQYLSMYFGSICMVIAGMVCYCKLYMRNLKLICMICVAPAFFATAVNETTRTYFRNFINQFLEIVTETIYMSIIMLIGFSFTNQTDDFLARIVLAWAVALLVCKPPRFLTGLINR